MEQLRRVEPIDLYMIECAVLEAGPPDTYFWSQTLPSGISFRDHIMSLGTVIARVATDIRRKTARWHPSVMLASPEMMAILDAIETSVGTSSATPPARPRLGFRLFGQEFTAVTRTEYDEHQPVPRGGLALCYAEWHDLTPGGLQVPFIPRQLEPGRPVAWIQIRELWEHPLIQLARCGI